MNLNHVGGDIWMEELSQKKKGMVSALFVWQADMGKGCQAFSGVRWISPQHEQPSFFIPDEGKPQLLPSPNWHLHASLLRSCPHLNCLLTS